ncbi:MFS transporter [Ochrobactrum cytisi]|nr:MFS transporter [Brucella cytisi]
MQSIIPFLTGKERAVNTNSASYLMMQSGTFVGALFSGFLLHYLPYDLAISSLGIVFCLSAVITFLMRLPAFLRPVYGKCDGQWKHYISIRHWSENNQGVAVLCYSLVFGAGTVINALLAAYVLKVLSGDAFLFGRLESARALGAVLVLPGFVGGARDESALARTSILPVDVRGGLILLWMFPNALAAGITLLVLGGFYNLGRISMDVQIQRTVDIASIGRAKGVINTVATGCGLFVYTLIWLNGDRLASSSVIAIYGLFVGTVGGLALTVPRTKFKAHRPGRGDHR